MLKVNNIFDASTLIYQSIVKVKVSNHFTLVSSKKKNIHQSDARQSGDAPEDLIRAVQ